jgi:hypothetical protein
MPIKYHQTMDKEIIDRVRKRHQPAMRALKALNFDEYGFFGETVQAFGFSPLGLPGVLGTFVAIFNEVSKVDWNLDVTVFNAAMASRDEAAYAAPFGLGVKFYTTFSDGTCVISANFESQPIRDEQQKLYKFIAAPTIEAAWSSHRKQVDAFCRQGKQKLEHLSFAGFLQLTQREDEYMLRKHNSPFAASSLSK